MQNNKPWARPVPESEPRPYSQLEVRLLSLITQIYDECEDDRRGGMANCHPLQQLVQKELAKHPSLQATLGCEDVLPGNVPFIKQCANCHEEWDKPRYRTDTCECGFKLDSADYMNNIQLTIHG